MGKTLKIWLGITVHEMFAVSMCLSDVFVGQRKI